ncbi:bifunctional lysylphosphatidylglycerol flippase/synthetase MprF [Salinisphaera hydrothermalis]|uniref:bifunctional lysylphosphatidylglycerol flippase/synthetase MprF n=1 Tax=Salinisphaera hydrothermalis TaxID=563188 RepID=UPI00055E90E2|nr:bifunctional lysylphosphatidylglycerol flippase/synthetase MprF [Salinisphaera hydrothermalis]
MSETALERSSVSARLRRFAPLLLIAAVAALLLVESRHVNLAAIQHALAGVAPLWLAVLGLGGLFAIAVMSSYDVLAARFVALDRQPLESLRLGMLANGINNIASLSGITGSGLRVLLLTRDGAATASAVRYAALVASASPLGLSALAWITLIVRPAILAATPVPEWLVLVALGVIALYLPAYFILATTSLLRFGPLQAIERIRPLEALAFITASVIDWAIAGALLWGCLAVLGAGVSPAAVIAAFALAATLGMLSFLPGGLGVFDVTLVGLLASHAVSANTAVAALVLYRVAYYLVPLIVALALGANELRASRLADTLRTHPAIQIIAWPVGRAVDLGIRVIAWLTAASGVVLLAGAAFPNLLAHTRLLRAWLPLPAVEASHMASVAIGLTLVFAARGLSLRLNRALWLALGLLVAGAVFGLLRGLDWGTSLMLAAVAGVLWLNRASFDRRGSLARQLGEWQWIAALAAALGVYFIIGEAFYPAHGASVFHFNFGAHGPRFLRGLMIALISVIVLMVWSWPRWPRPELERPSRADLDALAAWLESHGSNGYSHLMLLGDKTLRYSANEQAMIGFAAIRNRLIALGDPVGDTEARRTAIADFRRFAEDRHCTPLFYQVGPDYLSDYLDHGFVLFKLGEIGRVDLVNFSMKGKINEDKRGAINRGNRMGLDFELREPPFDAALMSELRAVSDDWLGEKPAEKAFSLGRFDADYLQRAPVALVRDADGTLIAFASILPSYGHREEYSIDLMRHRESAPGGTMDFLFVRLMQEAQTLGYHWFNLGMAPLAGVGDTPWANTAEQLARLAFEHGNRFYNYKGLRAFKEKWHPVWQSMYLAYPPEARLSTLQLDIAALIAGGYRRIIGH